MFVIEGLPALVLGIFAWFYLDDNPTKARFLTQEEKDALNKQLNLNDRKQKPVQ